MANIKKHIHGIIGAIIFLISFSTLLLILGFTTPLPLPEEEGVLLDFTSQSGNNGNPIEEMTEDKSNSANELPSDNVLSDNSDNPHIPGENITPNDVNPNESRINNLFDNAFDNNNSSNNNNSNNNNNPGIIGNNDGPDSGYGKLSGNRKFVGADPIAKDDMLGIVILEITVDESGKISNVSLVSTTCDQCVKSAIDAVKKWLYEPLPGSGYQIGTVTIEFREV